ncbi:MAG: hypothetical protein COB90_01720 [Hyphomicrobiales bacterium]|nr:MAG: hypothetical protein COB90_01720 [Hyphomicrobiales bacterium]
MIIWTGLIFFGFLYASTHAQAQTLCLEDREIGIWVNDFADNKKHIARIEIEAMCNPGTIAHLRIRIRPYCQPRLCTWGWDAARRQADGALTTSYRTFYAKRDITIRLVGSRMNVTLNNSYYDDQYTNDQRQFTLWREPD